MTWYEIRLQGQLDPQWADWFAGLAITHDTADSTMLRGPLVDQAALQGVLRSVGDLALTLLSVRIVEPTPAQAHGQPC